MSKSTGKNNVRFELYSGADNRFLLTEEAFDPPLGPLLARKHCAGTHFEGHRPDGLLVVSERSREGARMTIYNADGSRPEACGNGLRCVGWYLARSADGDAFTVDTDAGPRKTRIIASTQRQASIFTGMGPVAIEPLPAPWPKLPGLLAAYRGDVGNPHCILHVDDERVIDVTDVAQRLQSHPSFPAGVNVGFLSEREGVRYLRVHERGVGETSACGTGACAAAASLTQESAELEIRMHGGNLRVRIDTERCAELLGNATYYGVLDLEPPEGSQASWATCSPS
ncbi:MAG: diaminopimelate epimerase [Candidatus Paceibacteria bacterium]